MHRSLVKGCIHFIKPPISRVRGMRNNLTQDSQEGRSRHQGRTLCMSTRVPRSRCLLLEEERLLPHHMAYSQRHKQLTCASKDLRLSSPSCPFRRQLQSRGLGCLCRSPGFLPSCSFPFIHWSSPRHSRLWVRLWS